MKQDKFFNLSKNWSRRKHRLLRKYLPPFTAKLGSFNNVIYCIDGFAGKGKYGDNAEGSPLIMAQMADECVAWEKPVNLKIINVEAKRANFDKLSQHTHPWVIRGIVANKHGEFGQVLSDIISEIQNAPALFFIDPYGPSKIPFCDLLPIITRKQSATELIINFDVDGLRRLADRIQKNVRTAQGLKSANTTIALVTKILNKDSWEAQFKYGSLTTKEREDFLLREYMQELAKYRYRVVPYPIRESIGKAPKYYILFCTRHSDGIKLWNDIICDEEIELLKEATVVKRGQPFLIDGTDPIEMEEMRRRKELKQILLEYLQKVRTTTRGEVKNKFMFDKFGKFHMRDYNSVIQEMINTGILKTGSGYKRINDDVKLTYEPC